MSSPPIPDHELQHFHTEQPSETLQDSIAFFLHVYKSLTFQRLQNLLFYTDYCHYKEHGEQLTNTTYFRGSYAFYSETIYDALVSLDPEYETVFVRGKPLKEYTAASDRPESLSISELKHLVACHEETESIPSKNLFRFNSRTPIAQQTPYKQQADFSVLNSEQ